MYMYLLFDVPTGQIGHTLTLTFTDLDLTPWNTPDRFFERLILHGEDGLPNDTFTSYEAPIDPALPDLSPYVSSADEDGSILTFTGLTIGELYLKVVFKGKGGVSTGRLLAAVNRPH